MLYKYTLRAVKQQTLIVPTGWRIVNVHEQDGKVCLWARIKRDALPTKMAVTCVNTGEAIPADAGEYVGTAHLHFGRTVVHVFINPMGA